MFFFINHLPHTSVIDAIALTLSGVGTFGIGWFVVGAWLILREERKDHWFWLPLLTTGTIAWFLAEILFKNIFMRLRPTADMGAIIIGLNCCGYAFPSGHATIAFAMASLLANKEPRWRWIFYLLAILIVLSRIYLGKHFPLDVIVGGFLGLGIGFSITRLYNHMIYKRNRKRAHAWKR